MLEVKSLDLHAQYLSIQEEVDGIWREVQSTSSYVGGNFVQKFEADFAKYQGADFAVGVGNGTDAIEIALQSLDLPSGSEIIVPANSFVASSEAVTNAGFRVVFADVDDFYTLDPNDARCRITDRTAAMIAVHLYGQPANMDGLCDLANAFGLALIEDCAQAHGAEYRGRRVGSFGSAGTFSFYPGKNLGAYGDGGAIVTNDADLADRCRRRANHGRRSKYAHDFEGRNSRLDSLQAGVLGVKLRHLESWLERRRAVADAYDRGLRGISVGQLVLPSVREGVRHTFHLYVVRHQQRDQLRAFLGDRGIATGVHYPVALPDLEAYGYLGKGEYPNAQAWSRELLSLPIGEHLSDEQVDYVVQSVRSFVGAS